VGLIGLMRGPQGVPGPQGPGMPFVFVRKPVNEQVVSSTTLQADDHLSSTLPYSTTWLFELRLIWSAKKKTDLKLDLTVPVGSYCYWYTSLDPKMILPGSTSVLDGTDAPALTVVEGLVRTSVTAGALQLRWAQNSSKPDPVIVYAESILLAQRVA